MKLGLVCAETTTIICRFVDSIFDLDSLGYVQAVRELERALSKIALLQCAPVSRGNSSGSARKKFALMRNAVGDFIGSDMLRELLALADHNTGWNLELLSHAIHELFLSAKRQLQADVAVVKAA